MNVSLKVREELITQSRYPIKDARPPARPPGIHHSISRMHFVQPGQKWHINVDQLCATEAHYNFLQKFLYNLDKQRERITNITFCDPAQCSFRKHVLKCKLFQYGDVVTTVHR